MRCSEAEPPAPRDASAVAPLSVAVRPEPVPLKKAGLLGDIPHLLGLDGSGPKPVSSGSPPPRPDRALGPAGLDPAMTLRRAFG
jgi:hypothetical protein